MKMTKSSIREKMKGLEAELGFCRYKLQSMFPLEHWHIRELEIVEELKLLKRKIAMVKKGKK